MEWSGGSGWKGRCERGSVRGRELRLWEWGGGGEGAEIVGVC